MTVGQNIKTIRTEKNISQKKLADASGVGLATIQRIEYGQLNPKKETLHKIAKALGVHDADLDDSLKEMLQKWDTQNDVDDLAEQVDIIESLSGYNAEDLETFRQFLSLNPDGKQKVLEYIKDLTPKYKE